MAEFTKALIIDCPPEKAYEYLLDVTRHPEWASNPLEIEKTSEGPIAAGSTFRSVGKLMGTHTGEVRIVEATPNEKIVYESDDDTARMRHSFLLAPANGGTMLTKASQVLEPKSLLFKLASPMFGMIVPRGMQKDLENIKVRLEAQA